MANNLPNNRLPVRAKAKRPPTILLVLGAMLQTPENQDDFTKFLADRFQIDEGQFGRRWSCCLLIKNIISDRRHLILKALKWIVGIISGFFALPYAKDVLSKLWSYAHSFLN